ncbi:MAG: hypothetical protein Q7S66_05795 [bacterium]|nr:hypothetical protein [bacterium]
MKWLKRVPEAPPVPIILFLFLWLIVAVVEVNFAPSNESNGWATFQGLVLAASAAIALVIWRVFYHPECTLYFKVEQGFNEMKGSVYEFNVSCGNPSIGKVRVRRGEGLYDRYYFCEEHNPDSRWMREWLAEKRIVIKEGSLKRFRFNAIGLKIKDS